MRGEAHHAPKSQAHHSIMYESSRYSNRCAVRAGMTIRSFAPYSTTVSLPVMTSCAPTCGLVLFRAQCAD